MCFPYIKCNFVAKTWTRAVDSGLYFYFYTVFICLAGVAVGFDYFSVLRPLQ